VEASKEAFPNAMIIHEPMTLLTDYLLTIIGVYLAWRLHRNSTPMNPSIRWWFNALLALSFSALVGGSYHGFAPNLPQFANDIWWTGVLWAMSLIGLTMGFALVNEMLPFEKRRFWKGLIISKFLITVVAVTFNPQFIISIIDYGLVMLTWGAVAILAKRPWSSFIIAAVCLSVLAAWVQQSGYSFWKHLNNNDLFHLIQALAIISFYRAATQMNRQDEH
jgi:hypothetical protein